MKELKGFAHIKVPEGQTYQIGHNMIAYHDGYEPGEINKVISNSIRLEQAVNFYGTVKLVDTNIIVTRKDLVNGKSAEPVTSEHLEHDGGAGESDRPKRRNKRAGEDS